MAIHPKNIILTSTIIGVIMLLAFSSFTGFGTYQGIVKSGDGDVVFRDVTILKTYFPVYSGENIYKEKWQACKGLDKTVLDKFCTLSGYDTVPTNAQTPCYYEAKKRVYALGVGDDWFALGVEKGEGFGLTQITCARVSF